MLAEAADRDLHARAFDATYSWALWDLLHNITTKHAPVDALAGGYIAEHVSTWPRNAYRMNFIDNHDKNSWEGNMYSNFGPGLHAAIALTCTMDGIPMMYSGQEAGLNRSLAFFDKDEIEWKKDTVGGLYSKLFNLKQRNEALWNGKWGGEMLRIKNNKMQQVLSFVRQKNKDKVLVIANLSEKKADAVFETALDKGQYRELLTSQIYILSGKDSFKLGAWNFLVLEKVD